MISIRFHLIAILFITFAFILGCSSGMQQSVTTPGLDGETAQSAQVSGSRLLWGLYDVTIDTVTGQCAIDPLRTANFTANVNNLLEAQPGNLLIGDIDATNYLSEGRLDCTVTLKHPFPGLTQFNGFDVWGVFMHNANGSLAYDGLTYGADPDAGDNVAVLLNPDGWTRWFNYTEFNGNGFPIFEYWEGKLSNLSDPSASLNPFKIFADGLDVEADFHTWITTSGNADNRGWFQAGSVNYRRYELEFPIIDSNPVLNFQYAVIATWEPGDPALTGNPSLYEPFDFPTSANCEEAFLLDVSTVTSDLYYENVTTYGGDFTADIEVFDWQGGSVGGLGVPNEIERIILEGDFIPGSSYELSQTELAAIASPGTENSSVFQVEIFDCVPQASGEAGFWVIVESAGLNGGTYGQGFPTEYPDPASRAAFHSGNVLVDDESPFQPPECGEEVHEYVGTYNVTGVIFPDDHFLGDMTFMEVGPYAGRVLYQYADGRFGTIDPVADDQEMIPFNTESTHYANFNPVVDACPFSGRVFVGVRKYMDIFDSEGNLLGPFEDGDDRIMAAEIDDHGDLWALMRVGDEVRLRHYLYTDDPPYYQKPAAHDTDLSFKYVDVPSETKYWCGVDMTMDFEQDKMFVFAAIWPPFANSYLITVFDVSTGYAVELTERNDVFSGTFHITPGGVHPFCYGRKADIEIDHSLAEYCRIVVCGIIYFSGEYHLELIRLDDELNIIDVNNQFTGNNIVDMPMQFTFVPFGTHPIIATPSTGETFMYFHCNDW